MSTTPKMSKCYNKVTRTVTQSPRQEERCSRKVVEREILSHIHLMLNTRQSGARYGAGWG